LKLEHLPAKWQRLAVCESSNRPHVWSPSGEHYGYFQIHRGFFNVYNYKPGRLGLRKQYEVALYVYERQGPGAWSCAKKARFK
jgi:hypothetical protein